MNPVELLASQLYPQSLALVYTWDVKKCCLALSKPYPAEDSPELRQNAAAHVAFVRAESFFRFAIIRRDFEGSRDSALCAALRADDSPPAEASGKPAKRRSA